MRRVMYMGIAFQAFAGFSLSAVIYWQRHALAKIFSNDEKVQALCVDVSFQVALYYFLNSLMWAVWAPLEGMMRTTAP